MAKQDLQEQITEIEKKSLLADKNSKNKITKFDKIKTSMKEFMLTQHTKAVKCFTQ